MTNAKITTEALFRAVRPGAIQFFPANPAIWARTREGVVLDGLGRPVNLMEPQHADALIECINGHTSPRNIADEVLDTLLGAMLLRLTGEDGSLRPALEMWSVKRRVMSSGNILIAVADEPVLIELYHRFKRVLEQLTTTDEPSSFVATVNDQKGNVAVSRQAINQYLGLGIALSLACFVGFGFVAVHDHAMWALALSLFGFVSTPICLFTLLGRKVKVQWNVAYNRHPDDS